MRKKIYPVLLFSVGIFFALLFYSYETRVSGLEVHFFDVGQGDAILIKTPDRNILVDGGPDKKIMKRLGEALPFWDRTIDLMVLTHPHDDHVTGLDEVLKRFEVSRIISTGVLHSAPNYLAWMTSVRDRQIPVAIIDHKQKIDLGGPVLEILYPDESFFGKGLDNLNNTSVVMRLAYGQTDFLLTGDIEKEVEEGLLSGDSDISADVLKVGHHGSDTGTTEEFLEKVDPEIAIIEVGKKNAFGHPSHRVLKRLEKIGARVFRTDLDGTVKVVSDGKTVKLKAY